MTTDERRWQAVPAAEELSARLPGAVTDGRLDRGQLILWIDPQRIVDTCQVLKQELSFGRLSFITAIDWFPLEPRFEVAYSLHSFERKERIRLKCRVAGKKPELESVTSVWRVADWYEREVFDLFGIRFHHHPDLRRILMPEGWEGHPLRKDYPLSGPR